MNKHLFFLITWLFTLAGCVQNPASNDDQRVAAVVNGVEITNRQVNYYYSKNSRPGSSEKETAVIKRRILADLIRLELISEKAREMKLDQSPDYTLDLYMAQKKVLAGLAQKNISEKIAKATPQDADMVVNNNPMMFAGRHAFVYDEILISGFNMALLDSLDAMIEKGATKNQILNELKSKNIPFRETLRMQYSEQVPKPILSIVSGLKPGTPQVVNIANKISIVLVLHEAIPTPLTGETARKIAARMINQSRAKAAVAETMNSLVDKSKITYSKEYLKKIDNNDKQSDILKPNAERVTRKTNKKAFIGGLYAITFVLAMLALTAGMRALTEERFWMPQLWKKTVPETEENKTEDEKKSEALKKAYHIPYRAPESHIIIAVILGIAILSSLIIASMHLWNNLEIWITFICIASGLLIGYFASHRLTQQIARKWSRVTYLIMIFALTMGIVIITYAIKLFSTF